MGLIPSHRRRRRRRLVLVFKNRNRDMLYEVFPINIHLNYVLYTTTRQMKIFLWPPPKLCTQRSGLGSQISYLSSAYLKRRSLELILCCGFSRSSHVGGIRRLEESKLELDGRHEALLYALHLPVCQLILGWGGGGG